MVYQIQTRATIHCATECLRIGVGSRSGPRHLPDDFVETITWRAFSSHLFENNQKTVNFMAAAHWPSKHRIDDLFVAAGRKQKHCRNQK